MRGFRLSVASRQAILRWAAGQADKPTLSQAIHHLIERGLAESGDGRSEDRQKRRAREMAASTIDNLGDTTTTADNRANRKCDLLNGPEEFNQVRVDRPKRARSQGQS